MLERKTSPEAAVAMDLQETLNHRLVLPADSNHHGTLYAGSLLRIALESAYATACRVVGREANLLLRRVLSVECYYPVPVGTVLEIRGRPLHVRRAYLVVGLLGTPLEGKTGPWMDGLFGFVPVDEHGRPTPFPEDFACEGAPDDWQPLSLRLEKLLSVRRD
jgi:acyl-CoA hydrolase